MLRLCCLHRLHRRPAHCGAGRYEIVIGGWKNTQSVIRRSPQGPNLVTVSTKNILNEKEEREFWATAVDGKVVVGRGLVIGKDIIMQYTDPEPLEVKMVGVNTGYGSNGHWHMCAADDSNAGTNCGKDEYQVSAAPPVCKPLTVCRPGTAVAAAPTATTDRKCTPCPAGTSDIRGDNICTKCNAGTFVPAGSRGKCTSFNCKPGTYDADKEPSTRCLPCPATQYQPRTGAVACFDITLCQAGFQLTKPATPTSNVLCEECDEGETFNPTAGGKCRQTKACGADQQEDVAPTLTSDRSCTACSADCKCDAGFRSVGGACQPCPVGTSDVLRNNVCVHCGPGTYCRAQSIGPLTDHQCAPGFADIDQYVPFASPMLPWLMAAVVPLREQGGPLPILPAEIRRCRRQLMPSPVVHAFVGSLPLPQRLNNPLHGL